jgi:hypothetical protein
MKRRGCLIFVTIGLLTTLGLCTLLPLSARAGLIVLPRRAVWVDWGPIRIEDVCMQGWLRAECERPYIVVYVGPFGSILDFRL